MMRRPPADPGVAEWRSVLADLTRHLGKQRPGNYEAPLRAYAMSVERQSELAKSVLATLSLFPAVGQAPEELVYAVWRLNVGGTTPDGQDADALFQEGLEGLALANIVDVHRETSADQGAP